MRYRIIITAFLITIIVLNNIGFCLNINHKSIDKQQIKYGTISADQVWRNNIFLIGDVIIPKNVTVTIESGAKIKFASYDIYNVGKDKTKCEIIVYGTLDARPEINKPIKVSSINDHNLNKLTLDKNTQILKFYPYKIETEGLREEFRSFKIQYIDLWSLIYGLWVLRR